MFELLSNVLLPSLMASVGWGMGPYFDKRALDFYDNNSVFMLRVIISGLIALILFYLFMKIKKKKIWNKKKGINFIIYSSLLTVFVGTYFYFRALSKTKSTVLVVLISYVLPLIIITFISHYLLNEKINQGMILGVGIIIIGMILFVSSSKTT